MLLMIDNYDSFTYNLVQYFGELGEQIEIYRNDKISIAEIEQLAPEKIVISPGPCTPNEAGISLELIQHFKGKLPLLGVCLGHQSIAQAFGGKIINAEQVMHGKTSEIHHTGNDIFVDLETPFIATRYHSLIVETATLPDCFEITAWTETEDSNRAEIMAISHKEYAISGVQFHPESILSVYGHTLLKNFIDMANKNC